MFYQVQIVGKDITVVALCGDYEEAKNRKYEIVKEQVSAGDLESQVAIAKVIEVDDEIY